MLTGFVQVLGDGITISSHAFGRVNNINCPSGVIWTRRAFGSTNYPFTQPNTKTSFITFIHHTLPLHSSTPIKRGSMTASSPMTAASHPSVSSDLLPALTNGTTAPTSPSPLSPPSRSPSLSPLPEAQPVDSSSFTKKRKAPASDAPTTKKKAKGKENETPTKKGKDAPKAKAKDTAEKPEKGTYCHQYVTISTSTELTLQMPHQD